MGSTNQTTNYELPLFIGTDKPSWLGDFNGAMNKIDTSIKGNKDEIDSLKTRMTATESVANSASSSASTALTNANNAQTTANTAQSTANTANTKAEGAQSTANTALSNASTAQNTADTANSTAQSALTTANLANTEIAKFNLSTYEDTTNPTSQYGSVTNSVKVAKNSDGSLAKIYGNIAISNPVSSGTNQNTITFKTSLRPATEITIANGCLGRIINNNNQTSITPLSFTLATDGTVSCSMNVFADTVSQLFIFLPCLYWIKDFGDIVIPE